MRQGGDAKAVVEVGRNQSAGSKLQGWLLAAKTKLLPAKIQVAMMSKAQKESYKTSIGKTPAPKAQDQRR